MRITDISSLKYCFQILAGNQFSGNDEDFGNYTVIRTIVGPPPSHGRWYVGRFPSRGEMYQYLVIQRIGAANTTVSLKLTEVEVLATV